MLSTPYVGFCRVLVASTVGAPAAFAPQAANKPKTSVAPSHFIVSRRYLAGELYGL
jgi:hypothetical protein